MHPIFTVVLFTTALSYVSAGLSATSVVGKDDVGVIDKSVRVVPDQLTEFVNGPCLLDFQTSRYLMGITLNTSDASNSVVIIDVAKASPADKNGLKIGDIIVKIDTEALNRNKDTSNTTGKLSDASDYIKPCGAVTITYQREGEENQVTVVLAKSAQDYHGQDDRKKWITRVLSHYDKLKKKLKALPEKIDREIALWQRARPWKGVKFAALNSELAEYFGGHEGVLVVDAANPDIPLKGGDVIVRIDNRRPKNPDHLQRILLSYNTGEDLSVLIIRQKHEATLNMVAP